MNLSNRLLLSLLLATASTWTLALPEDKDQPIELAADSVDINETTGVSIYRGDVDLKQGSMRVLADEVQIFQKGRQPAKVIATGKPVRFEQAAANGLVKARARKAEYEVNSENLLLTGDAVLIQGKDTMQSDRIVYDRVRAQVKAGAAADGKQRVKITIQSPGK